MPEHKVSVTRDIPAPAPRAYAIIADYRSGHPTILPDVFRNLVVEKGGIGAGTVITFEMRAFGTTRRSRAVVAEPQPGRVLTETIAEEGIFTTFTVEPTGPSVSRVTIHTTLPTRGGVLGAVQRLASGAFLRKVYREELSRLATVAGSTPARREPSRTSG